MTATTERPVLTLHHGDAEAVFTEHPTEAARRALMEAATVESPRWAIVMMDFARALPPGERIIKAGR